MLTANQILHEAFQRVLFVADPQKSMPILLAEIFPNGIRGNCLVVGAGKASASMADAFEQYAQQNWPQAKIYGHVVTRYGHDVFTPIPNRKISISEASHPFPDEAGLKASIAIMQLVGNLQENDFCIALISGGGSSLLPLTANHIPMDALQKLTQELLRCGAPIEEINVIRKHVSAIQGGRLAQLATRRGAQMIALIISDVVGDQASDIASGPCAPDPSTYDDAIHILEKYQLHTHLGLTSIYQHLLQGQQGLHRETLKVEDEICEQINNIVFATAQKGLEAAAEFCRTLGYEVHVLGDGVSGESQEVAKNHAALIRECLTNSNAKKIAWISGGETTVTIPLGVVGRGGRCSEYLLALMQETLDIKGMSALAADTDGIDGSENNAGAYFDAGVRNRYLAKGLNIEHYLQNHQAYDFFEQLDALVMTGPTLTNVNDFRIILIDRYE
ncbi:hydroxypyruvate reductase [Polynucleobacter sp. SHI8]|uniref:glycerate kinase type-2 family protein n=1 Tax=unclassified Polynucleobacter TaxID=2640945 RepID=UPI002492BA6E|nr:MULTISPECIES: glycerate kinase [unclassified Polynucleobacter]BDW12099.1 hydroxypyruvate reductase [Polynucleobacter sp. SHI2]BDW14547.1 hydroxypyruvate reductase [Polynucleobacter sp. SHI8]